LSATILESFIIRKMLQRRLKHEKALQWNANTLP